MNIHSIHVVFQVGHDEAQLTYIYIYIARKGKVEKTEELDSL